jgi:hypothetical protein
MLYHSSLCFNDTSWTRWPITRKLAMSAFKLHSTTVYRRSDLSILEVTPTSELQAVELDGAFFRSLWDRILVPDPENIDPDPGLIGSVTSGLAWLQRVYNDTFPGDTTTPLGHLQNFLAVPFQFTVLCLQLANSSFPAGVHSILPLPDDMATTAVGGDSMQRLSGKPWVVWLFTASAGRVVLAIGLIFAWMVVLGGHLPPHCSGVLELDFALKCGPDGHAEDEAAEEETTLLSKQGVPRNVSPWRMAGALRDWSLELDMGWTGRRYSRSIETLAGTIWRRLLANPNCYLAVLTRLFCSFRNSSAALLIHSALPKVPVFL